MIAGSHQTNHGPMRFGQEGEEVFGCYDWTELAEVWGTVVGRSARVFWYKEGGGETPREGTATFTLQASVPRRSRRRSAPDRLQQ